jgi:hypothetical protein
MRRTRSRSGSSGPPQVLFAAPALDDRVVGCAAVAVWASARLVGDDGSPVAAAGPYPRTVGTPVVGRHVVGAGVPEHVRGERVLGHLVGGCLHRRS